MIKKSNTFVFVLTLASIFVCQAQYVYANGSSEKHADLSVVHSFEKYPAKISDPRNPSRLVLTTRLAKRYKTVITDASTQPVDFAGHYRVATWGCGTDCRGFAIINKLNGVVYTLPGVEYVAGVMGNEEDRLAFKTDSNLFIITGIINDEKEGKYYYLWKKDKLKLLAKRPVVKVDFSKPEASSKVK